MQNILREVNRQQRKKLNKQENHIHSRQKQNANEPKDHREYNQLIQEILFLKNKQQYQAALIKVDAAIKKYPEVGRQYQIKGEITFKLKQFEVSRDCFTRLVQKQKNQLNSLMKNGEKLEDGTILQAKKILSFYLYNKGLCLLKLNKMTQSIQSLKQSIVYNPLKIQSYLTLATCHHLIGHLEKAIKIYHKLIIKNQLPFNYLIQLIQQLCSSNDHSCIIELIQAFLSYCPKYTNIEEFKRIQLSLMKTKAESLRKINRLEEAILIYNSLIQKIKDKDAVIEIYISLAVCCIESNQIDKACCTYQQILQLDPANIQIMNNLANLDLRRGKYSNALKHVNKAIQLHEKRPNGSIFTLILLKCHRIIACAKTQQHNYSNDLKDVIQIVKSNFWSENNVYKTKSQQRNINFIKQIMAKYESLVNSYLLPNLPQSQQKDKQYKLDKMSYILIDSIEQQLLSVGIEESEALKLQKLQQRINKVYNQIVQFKKTTLNEYKQNCQNIHTKITDIQLSIIKKEEVQLKIEQELNELKQNYSEVYQMIESTKSQTNGIKIKQFIHKLKEDKKDRLAAYGQQMYWLFNAYFISITLISNDLVATTENKLHFNKIGSFFTKFRNLFNKLSHIPHLGLFCKAINSILTLYLNKESSIIYHSINKIITTRFCSHEDLKNALQVAIIELLSSNYRQQIQQKTKRHTIVLQMNDRYGRAREWYNSKKNKIINTIFQVQLNKQTEEEKIIKELVLQDVSAILVYMVKNREQYTTNYHLQQSVLSNAFINTLNYNFKKKEILDLYKRQQGQRSDKLQVQAPNCSSKCQIY